jgi:hypothetical protein
MRGRDGVVRNAPGACVRAWRRCGRWPGGPFCRAGLGPVQIGGGPALFKRAGPGSDSAPGRIAEVGRPVAFSQNSHNFPIILIFQLWNIQNITFLSPKLSKLDIVVEYFRRNNFTFWPNFKFPQDLKLQIPEQIQI